MSGEVQGRVEPVAAGGVEEAGQLIPSPGTRRVAGAGEAEVLVGGDVAPDEFSAYGEVEGGAHDHVDLEDGLGSEPVAELSARGGELAVEGLEDGRVGADAA